MDKRQFRRCLETCRRFGFRFDKGSSRWRSCNHLQRYKPASNPTQTPHVSSLWTGWWRQLPSICVGIGRRPAPSHARRRLGAVEVVRDSGHRGVAGRRQRSRMRSTREGAGPVRAGGRGGQLDRPTLLTTRPHKTAKRRMAFFSTFSPSFLFAERRRMVCRFYPAPSEMNVERGSKPTAELIKNQRKT
jgi:hypothetical protein